MPPSPGHCVLRDTHVEARGQCQWASYHFLLPCSLLGSNSGPYARRYLPLPVSQYLEPQLPSPVTSPPLSLPLPGFQPFVFAFPCATLITVLLVFLMYMTVRSAATQKDVTEVGRLDH